MSKDNDMIAWDKEVRDEQVALLADHNHPDNNGKDKPCKYIAFGMWDCGIMDSTG